MENLDERNTNNYVILKVDSDVNAVTNFKMLKKLYESGLYLANVRHIIDRGSDCAFNLVDTSKNCILFLLIGENALTNAKEVIETDKILNVEITQDLSQFKNPFYKYTNKPAFECIEEDFIYRNSNSMLDDDIIIDEISKFGIGIEKISPEEFKIQVLSKHLPDTENSNLGSIFLVRGYNVYNRLTRVLKNIKHLDDNVHFIYPKSNNKPKQFQKNYKKDQI